MDDIDALLQAARRQQKPRKSLARRLLMALPWLFLPSVAGWLLLNGPDSASLEKITTQLDHALPSGSRQITLYRWQDENGHWQFSEQKPAGTALFETITVSGEVNTITIDEDSHSGRARL